MAQLNQEIVLRMISRAFPILLRGAAHPFPEPSGKIVGGIEARLLRNRGDGLVGFAEEAARLLQPGLCNAVAERHAAAFTVHTRNVGGMEMQRVRNRGERQIAA